MKPRICVPLPVERFSDLEPMIRKAEASGADLIEVRLDYLNMSAHNAIEKLAKVVKRASVPLIGTNRQYEQGGYQPQNEQLRVQTLMKAAETGFRYVDIELTTAKLKTTVGKVKDCGAIPILSHHVLDCTPPESEMEKIVKSQIEAGAEICKLVTAANDVADNIRCLLFTRRMNELTKIVCFAMGRKGLLSRAFSPLFGAHFTFASLETGLETAQGQISIADLRELYWKLGVSE